MALSIKSRIINAVIAHRIRCNGATPRRIELIPDDYYELCEALRIGVIPVEPGELKLSKIDVVVMQEAEESKLFAYDHKLIPI